MKTANRSNHAGSLATLLLMLASATALAAQSAVDNSTPPKLVESAAKALLEDLDANRDAYRKDLQALYRMIDTKFLPHVDVQFAAQNVLGKHWRTASPEQRQRFIDAFTYSLQTTYGAALLDFTGDNLKIKPFRGDPAESRASVDTEIKRSNGALVQVSFGVRKTDAGGWKVWDVVIEGISYVKSFREDYGLQIDQKGLESLLKRLEDGKLAAK